MNFSTWQEVLDKAFKTGVYEPSLYVGDDGLVYGEAAEGLVILGRWGGGNLRPDQAPSPQNILPGLFGQQTVRMPELPSLSLPGFPKINWWIVAAVALGAVIVIRKI